MIYPFTVIEKSRNGNEWSLTISVDEVVRYEPSLDPATEFRTPIIKSTQLFHHVVAETEEEAMLEVARRVRS
jgi:hypothetical protein